MVKGLLRLFLITAVFCTTLCHALVEMPIVVIIPSYNNHEWTEETLISVLEQEYSNVRIIFVDDASTDQNYSIAESVIARYHAESRVLLVHNKERCGALANTYAAIHSCADDEVWIVLDGDDKFPHKQALATFNKRYQEQNAWASFGQYIDWPAGKVGHAEAFPEEIIRTNKLRSYRLPSRRAYLPITAPRTGYVWLFKLIKLQDLLYDDYFYMMAGDYAYMIPVLELAGFHGIFIPDILYVYNIRNPINDARVDARLQAKLALNILGKKPYQPVNEPVAFEKLGSNDVASLILVSENRPAQLSSLLYEILRKVRPVAGITVIYLADQTNSKSYQDLEAMFPTIRWVNANNGKLVALLQEQLIQVSGDFVLLSTDLITIHDSIAIDDDIRLLKKTHTPILFNGLGVDQATDLFETATLPPVNLLHTYYGWYCTNKKGNWRLPTMMMTLWEKQLLLQVVKRLPASGDKELIALLETDLLFSQVLSLIRRKALVTAKEV